MDKNKIIIVALIVIIIALLVGIAVTLPNMNKKDTKLTFESDTALSEGDSLKVKLTDENGTAIANQTLNITITGEDDSSDSKSVVTNDKGIATLKLDKGAGKYNVTANYAGNDKYNSCNATKEIKIAKKVTQSSSGGSKTHTIMGEDGYYYIVDDNGNILKTLGPSKQYYPDDPNSVYYPNAESGEAYINKAG